MADRSKSDSNLEQDEEIHGRGNRVTAKVVDPPTAQTTDVVGELEFPELSTGPISTAVKICNLSLL